MTRVRVKGFQIFRDRHGKWRCYHRRSRTAIDLEKAPIGSAEFFAECARISALARASGPPKPGTLALLIAQYQASAAFQDLAPRTQRDYRRVFDYLQPIADTALVKFDKPLIVRIRDKAATAHGRRFGNYVKQVFSLLFGWGAERAYLPRNPAEGIKNIARPRGAPRANRPWSDDERYVVIDSAPWHLKVPIALGMYAGLDEGVALSLSKAAYDGAALRACRSKTGRLQDKPVPNALREILDGAPAHDAVTIAANSRGLPWTESGFRASWRTFRGRLEKAGLVAPGLTFHGLRHTYGTILAEEGFDDRTIADALGHSTEAMARHYSRDADRTRKMAGVVKRFDRAENKRRARAVKPGVGIVKPEGGAG
ncbi:Phage integrase family protein [Methyloligella halotolerans]|uniref:Phage integrase family protein n=1 Tax=Methyloligella halotolerans TaxID=1177755 RepID=A0A1E2RYB9_9HYPH|nr:tyrosine-type recombinase/integrase [Methyloligella halotolerans]ODA67098.1 Phage integrase family protein [Methyloligella halotolerans]